jgi:hypothetical protein
VPIVTCYYCKQTNRIDDGQLANARCARCQKPLTNDAPTDDPATAEAYDAMTFVGLERINELNAIVMRAKQSRHGTRSNERELLSEAAMLIGTMASHKASIMNNLALADGLSRLGHQDAARRSVMSARDRAKELGPSREGVIATALFVLRCPESFITDALAACASGREIILQITSGSPHHAPEGSPERDLFPFFNVYRYIHGSRIGMVIQAAIRPKPSDLEVYTATAWNTIRYYLD